MSGRVSSAESLEQRKFGPEEKGATKTTQTHSVTSTCFRRENPPVNTLDGNDLEAPHRALCTALWTRAPCCTGTSRSDTSEPPHNCKREGEINMIHSD